jgi:hypothetical protein
MSALRFLVSLSLLSLFVAGNEIHQNFDAETEDDSEV